MASLYKLKGAQGASRRPRPAGPAPPEPDPWPAVAEFFAVLSEPTRLRILETLAAGPATVTEILQRLKLGQANTSKQLGILYRARLVDRTREGNRVRYALRSSVMEDLVTTALAALRQQAEFRACCFRPGRDPHRI